MPAKAEDVPVIVARPVVDCEERETNGGSYMRSGSYKQSRNNSIISGKLAAI